MARQIGNLNLNDLIKFGRHQINEEEPQEIIWRIAAKNHCSIPAYPPNSVTLHADKIIDFRPADAKETTNPDTNRTKYGNNRYLHSNMLQWLNSNANAGEWYKPQHMYDAPPDTRESINSSSVYYAHRPGFLHYFTRKEIDNILSTTIRVTKSNPVDGGGYEDIESRVFFPSLTEMGLGAENGIEEGSRWEIYGDQESRISTMTHHALQNTLGAIPVVDADSPYTYWLRTSVAANSAAYRSIEADGDFSGSLSYLGVKGVRPAFNLSGDTLVSDTVDADGCHTIIFDETPVITASASGDIGVQSTPFKQSYTITDADGDNLTITERINSEIIRTITNQQSGTQLLFDLSPVWQTLSTESTHTAAIEVTDGILTDTREWTFTRSNAAPTITAKTPGSLSKLAVPLNQEYTITDPNDETLTVIEKLDGQVLRTLYSQPSGTTLALDLTEQWGTLSKDNSHIASIEVSDGLLSASHTWTFHVIDPIEQHITSARTVQQPTGIIIPVLPVQVLVTNNFNEAEPVWEDASDEYIKRKQYIFKNRTKTADEWCVGVKYTVNGVTTSVKLTTIHELDFS